MLSRIQGFISRHRRKFFGVAVAGAVLWGGWSYISWKMQRAEEEYVREVLKKAKRHMHHKSSAQAAEKQVMALVPVAARATNEALDTNCIVNQLKCGSNTLSKDVSVQSCEAVKVTPVPLTPEEWLAKWNELKRVSIARAVAYAYIPSILIVFIRLQLGILGGYVFKSCGGDNLAAFLDGTDGKKSGEENQESMPFEIQEAYLSLTQFFLEGQSSTIAQKQPSPFNESEDDYLVLNDSYWSNQSSGTRGGKSRLNAGQQLTDNKGGNARYHSISNTYGNCSDSVSPSKTPREVHHGKLNGIADESNSVCMDSSSSGSIIKRKPMNNDAPSCFESMSSNPQPQETSIANIKAEEADELKDISSRETAEEDSGRCSGTDDTSEDEVLDEAKSKSGIEVLCSLLENKVGAVVDKLSLKTPMTLAETETLFWGILTSIRSNPAVDPAFNLPKYLLPPPQKIHETVQDIESHLGKKAATLFNNMVSETSDLLETKEVVELVQSCVSAGLGHIMDRMSNHFPVKNLFCDINPLSASSVVQNDALQKSTIPLAKLIPIVSKVAFEEGTPWVKLLLEMGNLKDFGANVYEAFTH